MSRSAKSRSTYELAKRTAIDLTRILLNPCSACCGGFAVYLFSPENSLIPKTPLVNAAEKPRVPTQPLIGAGAQLKLLSTLDSPFPAQSAVRSPPLRAKGLRMVTQLGFIECNSRVTVD